MNGVHALGWALVHFVWQGAAVAAALAVLLQATRHGSPATRYVLGVAALAALFLLPLGTALHLRGGPAAEVAPRHALESGRLTSPPAPPASNVGRAHPERPPQRMRRSRPWILGARVSSAARTVPFPASSRFGRRESSCCRCGCSAAGCKRSACGASGCVPPLQPAALPPRV